VRLVIAPVDRHQPAQPGFCLSVPLLALTDVSQGLQGDDVLIIQPEYVRKGRFRRRMIGQVLVATTQHDAGRDVVGVKFQTGREQFQGPSHVSIFPVHLRQGSEGESVRVFGVPAL
jgi:hypothetical protein